MQTEEAAAKQKWLHFVHLYSPVNKLIYLLKKKNL